MKNNDVQSVLITGATGYIGGRLVKRLLGAGYRVHVLVRDPKRLEGRPWIDDVQVYAGDVLQPDTLSSSMDDIDVAYYLIHSMSGNEDFEQRDVEAARNFSQAAVSQGVKRIIYLGGLGEPQADLSHHLRSRQKTGRVLREAGIPVTEFRAAVIVGSGSLSFEMVRYLTERVPIMICPRWVYTRIQPIGIGDVLDYLQAALVKPESAGRIIEVGGEDILTYADMMLGYAKVRGLNRVLLPVPVLTPRLSSYWVHWMTPVPASIARPLIEGLRNEVVVQDDIAQKLFPEIQPLDYESAVKLALERMEKGRVETIWSDSLASSQGDLPPVYLAQEQGMIFERRQIVVKSDTRSVHAVYSSLGGERGWLTYNYAWKLRGTIDRLIGGVGMRRGRRHPKEIRVGDALDFWRVEAIEPGHLLRLRAEMKVPGKAWLQFETNPLDYGKSELIQTAFFDPKGLFGLIYWYVLYPIHSVIFSSMIKKISLRAEEAMKFTQMMEK